MNHLAQARLRRSQAKPAPFHAETTENLMTAPHQAFLTETSFTSSLQAASSAGSGLSQGTSRQGESGARRNPTANPMAQESYVLCYVILLLCCFSPICLLRKYGDPTQRQKRRMLAGSPQTLQYSSVLHLLLTEQLLNISLTVNTRFQEANEG